MDISNSVGKSNALSKRGLRIMNDSSILEIGMLKCQTDGYSDANPSGVINAGTAENTISNDIIAEKLSQVESPYLDNPDILKYKDFTGITTFKNTLCSFLTKYANAHSRLNSDNLVILNGCGSCIAALTIVLCDPGDAWLIPTPYYNAINTDSNRLPLVNLVHVDLTSQESQETGQPFQLTVDKLEDALDQATVKGINIRGLFIMNPHNPLGDIYSKQLMKECLQFAKRHKLHVIMDEIYMLSVFNEETKFTSVLSLDDLPDPDMTHFIWGFSKDFSMSGLRCGAIYSWNKQVVAALGGVAYWFAVPTAMQFTLDRMLSDEEWVGQTYLPTNRKRLRDSYDVMSKGLTKLGIPHLVRSAGLYIWADFREFVSPLTFEAELEMFYELIDAGVYIPAGQCFYCQEPGWFRIIFALPNHIQQLVLQRIDKVISKRRKFNLRCPVGDGENK